MYCNLVEQLNKCAQEGSDVKLLILANLLISIMALGLALGVQGYILYKAWKAQRTTTYGVEIRAKKQIALDENANQLGSVETIAMTPEAEEDPSYVGQPSIQPEVLDLGFGQDSPRVDEVGLLKLTKFDSDLNFTITT